MLEQYFWNLVWLTSLVGFFLFSSLAVIAYVYLLFQLTRETVEERLLEIVAFAYWRLSVADGLTTNLHETREHAIYIVSELYDILNWLRAVTFQNQMPLQFWVKKFEGINSEEDL